MYNIPMSLESTFVSVDISDIQTWHFSEFCRIMRWVLQTGICVCFFSFPIINISPFLYRYVLCHVVSSHVKQHVISHILYLLCHLTILLKPYFPFSGACSAQEFECSERRCIPSSRKVSTLFSFCLFSNSHFWWVLILSLAYWRGVSKGVEAACRPPCTLFCRNVLTELEKKYGKRKK
jgi:hypothetical protein